MKHGINISAAAAALVLLLCSCGKKPSEKPSDPTLPDELVVSTGNNIPDNVVELTTESTQAEEPDDVSGTEDDVNTDEPQIGDSQTGGQSTEAAPPTTEPSEENITVEEISDTEAMRYLRLLNSSRVHARLTEMYSFDGDELFSAEREYYINGSKKIFINDGNKSFYVDGTATYVDYGREIYYSYIDQGGDYLNFGFDEKKYILLSDETLDGVRCETYNIDGEGLVSTWEFGADGRLRVSDRYLDSDAFNYYIFDVVESDVSGMDFTIPDYFTEVNAEDYEFFY